MLRKMATHFVTCLLLLVIAVSSVDANIELPSVFGHHMVLQRNLPIKVWGNAQHNEKVTVEFAGQTATAIANIHGEWSLSLPAQKANAKPQTMTLTGNNTIILNDILIGDVWVCSGQSNMEWPLRNANNKEAEIAAAQFPNIRLFNVVKETSPVPLEDVNASWAACTPQSSAQFSAVGYFFGRNLHQHLNIPIGLIGTYWGGTPAQSWISHPALRAALTDFNKAIDDLENVYGNKDKLMADYHAALKKYKQSIATVHQLQSDQKAALQFANTSLDTSDWKPSNTPGNWEKNGYPNMDGILWYRKTIDVPQQWAGKDLLLMPGPIDEVDQAFFNGTYIDGKGDIAKGETEFWNVPRKYRVPGKLVKAGKNVIAIRVFDLAGQGGLWGGDAADMYATLANGSTDKSISLAGPWLTKIEYQTLSRAQSPFSAGRPGVLFNAMVNPIVGYGIKGAIWYQGESNAGNPMQYRTLMPTLIKDWRDRWEVGQFPFFMVSLANFRAQKSQPSQDNWAELREAQLLTAIKDPNTGISMTIDIGEAKDIHPRNKQDVGYRLFLQAREIAYGEKLVAQGPLFKSMKIDSNKATLTFDNVGGGLVIKGDKLKGFEIQGDGDQAVWADAVIKGNTIIVSAEGVDQIKAVRYGWAINPDVNLYNKEGLPAVPFRTDVP